MIFQRLPAVLMFGPMKRVLLISLIVTSTAFPASAQEDTGNRRRDPADRRTVARDEHIVEHRLHKVTQAAQRRAFDRHEKKCDKDQLPVAPKIALPDPAKNRSVYFGVVGSGHVGNAPER